ncbi:conserved hypothetical protein [Methylocella silvestris BL2]|uniref:Lipoprotein n=1 Tax=Methylocella silvestris (strain DSM 15510 / CIP 108128 / LMG 27833 / NCIMB 13906 / BL2) TaxID=395965 RepID=B8EIZ5_METSB|nr:TorF family putative porin [Methylocella silvestris]ACK52487.1 conserved hypothetical protein [Methylocella silvestris BL2]
MTNMIKSVMTAAAGVLLASAASAADLAVTPAAPPPPPIDLGFGMKLANDYVFRGIDNSNGHFAAQGYLELRAIDWIYAGVWTSNVSFPTAYGLNNPSAEIDLYGGLRHTWGALTLDLGGLYYEYPSQTIPAGGFTMNYYELYFKPTYVINDTFTIGGNVYGTTNFANSGSSGIYASGTLKVNFPTFLPWKGVATYASGEFGGQFLDDNRFGVKLPTYATWNVGLGATYDIWTLDVRYSGSSLSQNSCALLSGVRNWCGNRFIASIAVDTSILSLMK